MSAEDALPESAIIKLPIKATLSAEEAEEEFWIVNVPPPWVNVILSALEALEASATVSVLGTKTIFVPESANTNLWTV